MRPLLQWLALTPAGFEPGTLGIPSIHLTTRPLRTLYSGWSSDHRGIWFQMCLRSSQPQQCSTAKDFVKVFKNITLKILQKLRSVLLLKTHGVVHCQTQSLASRRASLLSSVAPKPKAIYLPNIPYLKKVSLCVCMAKQLAWQWSCPTCQRRKNKLNYLNDSKN